MDQQPGIPEGFPGDRIDENQPEQEGMPVTAARIHARLSPGFYCRARLALA
jgi:hypothetical protein